MAIASPKRVRARRGQGERLREEIVAEAEKILIRTQDEAAVSIRAVAEAVGVTPPSIYMHFTDKDDLLLAVCERHFAELGRRVGEAMAAARDPVEHVKAAGRAYVRFGLENPEPYRILFMGRKQDADPALVDRVREVSCFDELVAAVEECVRSGAFAKRDPFLVATALWMSAHGVVSLLISKPWFPWPDRGELTELCTEMLCRGLMTETTAKRKTSRPR